MFYGGEKIKMPNMVKEFRKKKNLTQLELAKQLGITNDYLSAIERGSRTPGFKLAKKIADYFQVTVDTIFFENSSNKMFEKSATI